MKKMILASLVAAAFLGQAMVAQAAVVYEPGAGGFVGKGDVQVAFGWNNKQLQDNASKVTFTYDSTDVYEGTCTWEAGKSGNVQTKSRTISLGVDGSVAVEARKNSQGQITGFSLGGFSEGEGSEIGSVPKAGELCDMAEGNGAVWSTDPIRVTEAMGGLYAHFEDQKVLLWSEFFDIEE